MISLKKNQAKNCNNHKTNSPMSYIGKIAVLQIVQVLESMSKIEEVIEENQFGF
jgi:hypothetical protein